MCLAFPKCTSWAYHRTLVALEHAGRQIGSIELPEPSLATPARHEGRKSLGVGRGTELYDGTRRRNGVERNAFVFWRGQATRGRASCRRPDKHPYELFLQIEEIEEVGRKGGQDCNVDMTGEAGCQVITVLVQIEVPHRSDTPSSTAALGFPICLVACQRIQGPSALPQELQMEE